MQQRLHGGVLAPFHQRHDLVRRGILQNLRAPSVLSLIVGPFALCPRCTWVETRDKSLISEYIYTKGSPVVDMDPPAALGIVSAASQGHFATLMRLLA